ncbi:MAG: hypothetical protein LQ340_007826, partial [Diploschistes diacapsis]
MPSNSTSAPISPPSFFQILRWRLNLLLTKSFLGLLYRYRMLRPSSIPVTEKPSYTKHYPILPSLVCHVFVPPSATTSPSDPSSEKLYPLLITIHGGGFCVGHPFLDDPDNAYFAQRSSMVVVGINYGKAPEHRFPGPAQDCAKLMGAVLDDGSLPVDARAPVAVAGFSAGGSLALAAPMLLDDRHRRRIGAVVAYYPSTDPAKPAAEKLAAATPPPYRTDVLADMMPMFKWAYAPPTPTRDEALPLARDPLFAPAWADRASLPQKV